MYGAALLRGQRRACLDNKPMSQKCTGPSSSNPRVLNALSCILLYPQQFYCNGHAPAITLALTLALPTSFTESHQWYGRGGTPILTTEFGPLAQVPLRLTPTRTRQQHFVWRSF
ncbi:unnamed protein product, partial [Laminaria digitata]